MLPGLTGRQEQQILIFNFWGMRWPTRQRHSRVKIFSGNVVKDDGSKISVTTDRRTFMNIAFRFVSTRTFKLLFRARNKTGLDSLSASAATYNHFRHLKKFHQPCGAQLS